MAGWTVQKTLDAFGVGFVVGGVVNVLAISALNQVIAGEQKQRENHLAAQFAKLSVSVDA